MKRQDFRFPMLPTKLASSPQFDLTEADDFLFQSQEMCNWHCQFTITLCVILLLTNGLTNLVSLKDFSIMLIAPTPPPCVAYAVIPRGDERSNCTPSQIRSSSNAGSVCSPKECFEGD